MEVSASVDPSTNGRVVLETSVGKFLVELFSKEAPKACRNFCQLCMERHFEGAPFERIVKGTLAQTGDPEGSLSNGSVFGEPFEDEINSRLMFDRAGRVAMASDENKRKSNESKFFITLGACEWLNKKHTIFGQMTKESLYDALKLNDAEVGPNDVPVDPKPFILAAKVIVCPFDDIVPRRSRFDVAKAKKAKKKKKLEKEKRKRTRHLKNRDTRMLAFGDEEIDDDDDDDDDDYNYNDNEQDDNEHGHKLKSKKTKKKKDKKKKDKSKKSTKEKEHERNSSSKKRSREQISSNENENGQGKEQQSNQDEDTADSKRRKEEAAKLRESIQSTSKKLSQEDTLASKNNEYSSSSSILEKRKQKYLKFKAARKKSESRQKDTLAMLDAFNMKLREANTNTEKGKESFSEKHQAQSSTPGGGNAHYSGGIGENEMEQDLEKNDDLPNLDKQSWMRTKVKFKKHVDDDDRIG